MHASPPPGLDPETERTTAVTDVLLALVAGAGAGAVLAGGGPPLRTAAWAGTFACLALGGLAGAVVHGVHPGGRLRTGLWGTVFLSLGLTLYLVLAAALLDRLGPRAGGPAALVALPILGLAYGLALGRGVRFGAFVAVESVVLVAALALYLAPLPSGRPPGAGWIGAGLLLSLLAGGVQALYRGRVRLIWPFDRNGLFHLVQIAAVLALLRGVTAG